jgi:hypothetical protein
MTWFDLGALAIVALAVVDGATSGFLWSLLESAFLVTTAMTARGLAVHAQPYVLKVADLGPDDLRSASHVAVFLPVASTFLGVLILLHPASRRWRFRRDAWLGGAWGAVNGIFGSTLLFSMAMWSTPRAWEEQLAASRLSPVLACAVDAGLAPLYPEPTVERLRQLERR